MKGVAGAPVIFGLIRLLTTLKNRARCDFHGGSLLIVWSSNNGGGFVSNDIVLVIVVGAAVDKDSISSPVVLTVLSTDRSSSGCSVY